MSTYGDDMASWADEQVEKQKIADLLAKLPLNRHQKRALVKQLRKKFRDSQKQKQANDAALADPARY